MKTVNKKIWPKYFNDVLLRNKRFELRQDDDDIQVGDILNLQEWDPDTQQYTGRQAACSVTYVLRNVSSPNELWNFGLRDGFCIIGFARWN